MKEAVLYTGTFDPFHLGHLWQLERTYKAHPFELAVIAVIESNPKKPRASKWQYRVTLAELMLSSRNLPFKYQIHGISYVDPDNLKRFTAEYLRGYNVIRTAASDSIVEFASDKDHQFNVALTLFHYAIVVRPLVGQREVEHAIELLPKDIAGKFSYEIVHVQAEDDIAATDIRKSPARACSRGYITNDQLRFITANKLYVRK